MANDVEGGKKNRDYNIQKADIHSFQGPTASFAIPQGVFCTIRSCSAEGSLIT